MANEYCAPADVYTFGLPRGALSAQARTVATVSASTETIELDEHGFETGMPISFRAAEGGAMPSPLVEGTTYYAIRVDAARFQVAATVSGAAINLTTAGSNVMVAAPLPILEVIEAYSRWSDCMLPAEIVPFAPGAVPVLVKMIVAELAAKKLLHLAGQTSEAVDAAEASAEKKLARFATGKPVRDARAATSANKAVVGSLSGSAADARGWKSGVIP